MLGVIPGCETFPRALHELAFILQSRMAPPTYADLGKASRDVFGKGFHFGLCKLDVKVRRTKPQRPHLPRASRSLAWKSPPGGPPTTRRGRSVQLRIPGDFSKTLLNPGCW